MLCCPAAALPCLVTVLWMHCCYISIFIAVDVAAEVGFQMLVSQVQRRGRCLADTLHTIGTPRVRSSSFHLGRDSAVNRDVPCYIHKRGGQRSPTYVAVTLSPWHWPDTLSPVTCLSVCRSVRQTSLPVGARQRWPLLAQRSAPHTGVRTQTRGPSGSGRVSARVVTLRVKPRWLL